MIVIGAAIMYAGLPELVEYYVEVEGLPAAKAREVAFENPDRVAFAFIVFGGTLRRLLLCRGTRVALKRNGAQRDVKLIANSSSEQCVAALQASAGQPGV